MDRTSIRRAPSAGPKPSLKPLALKLSSVSMTQRTAAILEAFVSHLTMMNWLPIPSDFRGDLRMAIEAPLADRLDRLAVLAQHRLGLVEAIQLDRALGEVPIEQTNGFSTVRLAILASSTVDHVAPAIRVA